MKKILALILFLLLPSPELLAESGGAISERHKDFLKLLYFHKSEISARYEIHTEAEEDGGPGAFDLQQFSLDLDFPVSLSRDTYVSYGGGYHIKLLDFNDVLVAPTFEDDGSLQKVFFKFGMAHFLTDNLLLKGYASIGSYSDTSNSFDVDSIKVFGEGLLVYRLNPGAQLLVGVRSSEDFDDNQVFPIVGLRIQDSDGRFHISLTAPLELKLSFHADKNTEFYGRAWIEGDRFLVEKGPLNLDFDAQFHERRVAVGFRQWLGSYIALTLEVGSSFDSELEYKIENPGLFTDGDLDNSFFGAVSLDLAL